MSTSRFFHLLLLETIFSCAFHLLAAQAPVQPASSDQSQRLPVVEQFKKTVVFLETDCVAVSPEGQRSIVSHAGTAFLLSKSDTRLKNKSFTYLVTNRHVAQPGIEAGSPCEVARYIVRADTKIASPGGSYSIVEPVPTSALHWYFPADPSADLAITPIAINAEKLDIISLPSEMLLSDDDRVTNKIVEGDSVIFTGLFVQMIGQIHSEPIVREGKIAMMPREKIPTTVQSLLGDVYLVDAHVFGGNSGSPIFVNFGGQRDNGLVVGFSYKLLGVISGYVKENTNFVLQPVASYAGTMEANSGIAMVVPAQKILDILNSPPLIKQRDEIVAAQLSNKE